jgi:hypothetical protein
MGHDLLLTCAAMFVGAYACGALSSSSRILDARLGLVRSCICRCVRAVVRVCVCVSAQA